MKYEELKDEIKAAMKAHDNVRRDILRQVHGEIKNIEVIEGSIKAANNDERTAMLKEQVEILEGYLPKQLAGDELVALVEKTIADLGATTKREMGKVMGALTAATGGNFDKAQAAKEVGSRLS